MLNQQKIKKLFRDLNSELKKQNVKGEIGLCGGAVMCLVFQCRQATKDVDGIFRPTQAIRQAAAKVAGKNQVPQDWLNDGAKAFFSIKPSQQEVMELSHLRIWAPQPEYMLAMKCISARYDSHDQEDVIFLIQHLRLQSTAEVLALVENFYPKKSIPAKTQFLIEEILGSRRD